MYHVVADDLSSTNSLASCHAGWFEVIMELLKVDETILLGRGHLGVAPVGIVCSVVGVVVSLLQAMDGADRDVVSFHQGTLLCFQSADNQFALVHLNYVCLKCSSCRCLYR